MIASVSDQNYPTKGLPCSIIHRLVATLFHKIMYLYSINLVSTSTCCDATITHANNIRELHTLPNSLLVAYVHNVILFYSQIYLLLHDKRKIYNYMWGKIALINIIIGVYISAGKFEIFYCAIYQYAVSLSAS